jgi:hypothetical protein
VKVSHIELKNGLGAYIRPQTDRRTNSVTFTQSIHLLSQALGMRSVVIVKNADPEIFTDLHVLSPS